MKAYVKCGKITEKCNAQLQLQMYLTNRKKCFFCVADPEFEVNGQVKILAVNYDEGYVSSLILA